MTGKQLYKVLICKDNYLINPLNNEEEVYTRGEAIKKARAFNGKIEKVEQKLYDSHSFATCSVQDVRDFLKVGGTLPTLTKMTDDELDTFIERCSRRYVIHNADYGINFNELERLAK